MLEYFIQWKLCYLIKSSDIVIWSYDIMCQAQISRGYKVTKISLLFESYNL